MGSLTQGGSAEESWRGSLLVLPLCSAVLNWAIVFACAAPTAAEAHYPPTVRAPQRSLRPAPRIGGTFSVRTERTPSKIGASQEVKMEQTKKIAENAAGAGSAAFPPSPLQGAKSAILDHVGVTLAGSRESASRIAA